MEEEKHWLGWWRIFKTDRFSKGAQYSHNKKAVFRENVCDSHLTTFEDSEATVVSPGAVLCCCGPSAGKIQPSACTMGGVSSEKCCQVGVSCWAKQGVLISGSESRGMAAGENNIWAARRGLFDPNLIWTWYKITAKHKELLEINSVT